MPYHSPTLWRVIHVEDDGLRAIILVPPDTARLMHVLCSRHGCSITSGTPAGATRSEPHYLLVDPPPLPLTHIASHFRYQIGHLYAWCRGARARQQTGQTSGSTFCTEVSGTSWWSCMMVTAPIHTVPDEICFSICASLNEIHPAKSICSMGEQRKRLQINAEAL